MPSKKRFIDKRNAETFRVVHRSRRDLDRIEKDDEASELVLAVQKSSKSSSENQNERPISSLPREVLPSKEIEIPGEETPYEQSSRFPELFIEVDPEIEAALEGGEEYEGELPDDFVEMANRMEPDDYKYSIRSTIQKKDDTYSDDDEQQKPIAKPDDERLHCDADVNVCESQKQFPGERAFGEQRMLLEERFSKVLKEYSDDEIGELDEEDDSIKGKRNVFSASDLGSVLDDFVQKHLQKITLDNSNHSNTSSVNGLESGIHFQTQQSSDERIPKQIESCSNNLVVSKKKDSEEETLEYVTIDTERNEINWDCESILSTLSDSDNLPALIEETSKKPIRLSKRTGIPIDAKIFDSRMNTRNNERAPRKSNNGETIDSKNRDKSKRLKNETNEEKRTRKKAIKEERQLNREKKKALRIAFRREQMKQQLHLVTPALALTARVVTKC